jgi:NAD(P)-dependent dehydrogenase (short-subunit alcohol dehydrogenase family)
MNLKGKKVIVVGGASGMGFATVQALVEKEAEVILWGRTKEKAEAAARSLNSSFVRAVHADITKKNEVEQCMKQIGNFDHLVVTAADLVYGPVEKLELPAVMRAIESKILAALFLVQASKGSLSSEGSICFVSGIAAQRPMPGGSIPCAVNGAVDSFGRAMAVELSPIRVNVVSPGWTDTKIWDMAGLGDRKLQMFAQMKERLPAKRIGQPEDIASAIVFCLENPFVTGQVLQIDGGHRLC